MSGLPNADLLPHADPKNGDPAGEVPDGIATYARIGVWVAGTGTYDQLSGFLCDELLQRNLVVPKDGDGRALEDKILVDVPGKGIIVVNEDEVGCCGHRQCWLRVLWRVIDDIQ